MNKTQEKLANAIHELCPEIEAIKACDETLYPDAVVIRNSSTGPVATKLRNAGYRTGPSGLYYTVVQPPRT
jgi:hypothetical protein